MFDVRQLEVFIEIAQSGGFNRAAARLHIAQSALSRRILQLEHEIGVPLLIRGGRGVQLTSAGTLLYERAQVLLRQLKQVREEVAAEALVARGELAIGFPPSLEAVSSAPLLRTLKARFPALFVKSWVATSIVLRDMLVNGKVDIAIFGVLEPEPILNAKPLFRDAMYLVGPPGAVIPETASWGRVASLPMILTSEPNSVRRLVEDAAAKRRLKLNVVMEVNDVPLLIDLVKSGVGHSLLPQSAIRNLAREGVITASRVPGLIYSWIVAWSKERPLSAAGQQAIALLQEMSRDRSDTP